MVAPKIKVLPDVRSPRPRKIVTDLSYLRNYQQILNDLNKDNLMKMKNIFIGFSSEAWKFNLIINDAELLKQVDNTLSKNLVFARTLEAAKTQFVPAAKQILILLLKDASDGMPDGAFPREYKIALGAAVMRMPNPEITGSAPQSILVELPDLYKHLGDYEDYEKGFHDQALLATNRNWNDAHSWETRSNSSVHGGGRVILPFESSNDILKEKNPGVRYRAWKALYQGQTGYFQEGGLRRSSLIGGGFYYQPDKFVEFPPGSSWNATKAARLRAWGSKAPYWLILEYGQPTWEPKATPKIVNAIGLANKFRRKIATGSVKVGSYGGQGTGFMYASEEAVISRKTVYFTRQSGNRPANISIAWVEALNILWTNIITSVWAEQVAAFNSGSTGSRGALLRGGSLGPARPSASGAGGPAGGSSGTYHYQTGGAFTGRGFGSSSSRSSVDAFVNKYIEEIKKTEDNFRAAVDRVMADFDKFGGY